jgi:hypothetical protein
MTPEEWEEVQSRVQSVDVWREINATYYILCDQLAGEHRDDVLESTGRSCDICDIVLWTGHHPSESHPRRVAERAERVAERAERVPEQGARRDSSRQMRLPTLFASLSWTQLLIRSTVKNINRYHQLLLPKAKSSQSKARDLARHDGTKYKWGQGRR